MVDLIDGTKLKIFNVKISLIDLMVEKLIFQFFIKKLNASIFIL